MANDDPRAIERRTCANCKQPAVTCVHVTQHLLNGVLPIGRTYVHRCGACKAGFESESVFRTMYECAMGAMMFAFGGFGVALVVAWVIDFANGATGLPTLYQAGMGALLVALFAMGVYLPIRSGMRIVALVRNPIANR